MNEHTPQDPNRQAQWEADRITEGQPLPGADVKSYIGREGLRQSDLEAAEKVNIARAAGELSLTTTEWQELRTKLGRSPRRSDME